MNSAEMIASLTPKQQRWVRAYIDNGGNNTDACRSLGLKNTTSVYLKNSACMAAVAAVYREAAEAVAPKVTATKEWLLDRLVELADADMGELFDDEDNLLPVKQWPAVWRRGLVAGVDVTALAGDCGTVTKAKLADRLKVLDQIGRHTDVGAFRDRIELDMAEDLVDKFARRRAAARAEEENDANEP